MRPLLERELKLSMTLPIIFWSYKIICSISNIRLFSVPMLDAATNKFHASFWIFPQAFISVSMEGKRNTVMLQGFYIYVLTTKSRPTAAETGTNIGTTTLNIVWRTLTRAPTSIDDP
jgi:hypothetical protein